MPPGSKAIQDRSEREFRAAIDRLRSDVGTHEDHRKEERVDHNIGRA